MLVNEEPRQLLLDGITPADDFPVEESFRDEGAHIVRIVTRRDGFVTNCRVRRAMQTTIF
jgi:hypothetical protein